VRPEFIAFLTRLWLGSAAGIGAGFLAFRGDVFRIHAPQFQCVTLGVFVAALLALVRSSRIGFALMLACAFGLFRLGLVRSEGWLVGTTGLVQAGGLFLAALIFDLLARRGILFGKFLVFGPLVAGVFLAAAPMSHFHELTRSNALPVVIEQLFIGLVVGNGVGFGMELADLGQVGGASAFADRRGDPD